MVQGLPLGVDSYLATQEISCLLQNLEIRTFLFRMA